MEFAGSLEDARVDEELVRGLLAEQAPRWRDLPLRPTAESSNDHHIFSLGDELSVRLPRASRCIPQVEKEQTWMPRLGDAGLPLAIPTVVHAGRPSRRYPAPWSIYDWIPGEVAASAASRASGASAASAASGASDRLRLAADLAGFLVRLRAVDATGGPPPGEHTAFRGAPLEHGDEEVRSILNRVPGRERDLAAGIWRDALEAAFSGPPVWFHGDVSLNNLLLRDGRLHAVIDFGCAGVGDPACDTVIQWTAFTGAARELFRRDYGLDDATWARGRGWALWKGLIMITNKPPGQAEFARHVLDQVFDGD